MNSKINGVVISDMSGVVVKHILSVCDTRGEDYLVRSEEDKVFILCSKLTMLSLLEEAQDFQSFTDGQVHCMVGFFNATAKECEIELSFSYTPKPTAIKLY